MVNVLKLQNFVNHEGLLHAERFPENPLQLLGNSLKSWLENLLDSLNVGQDPLILGEVHPASHISGRVYIASSAKVEPGAMIQGPAYIGPDSEVRHTAYIRGYVYVGQACVVGHATEVKGSCFFDGAKAGHFAYVGDSLLGRQVNLGAGTKLANLKLRGDEVKIRHPESGQLIPSGLRKLGALLGDFAQTGCNAVLSPGTILCPHTAVLPCAHFHGTLTKGIAKT